jgi:hypothetical protein
MKVNAQQGTTSFQVSDGKDVYDVDAPIEPLLVFAGRLYQGMLAARYNQVSGAEVLKRKPVLMPKKFDIATLDLPNNPPVVLVLDGGAATEISFAIPLDQAFAVGEAICQRANDLKVQKGSVTAAPRTPN